nr:hypothetical protein CFP56_30911 [Quercus suber]
MPLHPAFSFQFYRITVGHCASDIRARLNLLDGFCSHRPEERHTFSFTYHGESSDKQYTAHQFATDNHEGHNARSTYAATVGSLEASASPDKQNVVVFMHVPCVSTGSERLTSLGNVFRHQSGLGSFLASRLQARIRFTMTGSATEHLGTFRRPQARCFGRRYIKLKIPSRHYRGSGRSAVLDKGLQYSCLVTKTDGSERLRRPGIGRYIGQPGPYLKLVALWLLSVSSRNITSCSYGIGSRSYRLLVCADIAKSHSALDSRRESVRLISLTMSKHFTLINMAMVSRLGSEKMKHMNLLCANSRLSPVANCSWISPAWTQTIFEEAMIWAWKLFMIDETYITNESSTKLLHKFRKQPLLAYLFCEGTPSTNQCLCIPRSAFSFTGLQLVTVLQISEVGWTIQLGDMEHFGKMEDDV